jgi:hypothetical protein
LRRWHAKSRRRLAASQRWFREQLGDDYVEPPLSDNPIADTIRMLAESRRMLAEDPLEDPLPD